MDFERAYNDLIARINVAKEKPSLCMKEKHHYNGYVETGIHDALDYIINPESEDERIRKEIVDFLLDGIWCEKIIDQVRQSQRYSKWISYLEKQKELTRENVIKELEKEFYECGTTPKWFHNAMQGAINYGKATALGEIKPPTVNIEKQKEQKSYEPHNWPANKDNLTQEQKHTNSEKPKEWSEEDETAYGDLIWCIEQAKKSAKDENDMGNIWFVENWIKNRIKSLRPQPKQNWSEEDEDKVDDICKLIEHATIIPRSGDDDTGIPPTRLNDKYKGELKAFVKYLRNRLTKSDTWKPSEEQMAVLYDAISDLKHDNYKNTDVLESLYNDLKKLSYEIY